MAIVTVREVPFAYDEAGPPDAAAGSMPGGTTILFIHGWACDRTAWAPQFADLSRDHRCIAVDLRGRGETPAIGPYDTTTAADDLAAILEALDAAPAVVIGHSLGGLIGLLLSDRHPDAVLGLVMGDSPLSSSSGGGFPQTVKVIRDAGSMSVVADTIVERWFVETTSEEIKEQVRRMVLSCPPDVAAGMLSNNEVFPARMGELLKNADTKPLMAIWAARPLGNPDRLRDVCHFIRQEPMGDCRHFFQLEEPAITSAILRAFLDDVRDDPRIADQLASAGNASQTNA